MAAIKFLTGKKAILDADVDLLVDTIKAVLLKTASSLADTADFLADVTAGDMVGTAQTLGSKSTTDGVFDAADITFSAVALTGACDRVLLYKDTGNSATSQLLAAVALASAVTPNGGDIVVAWDNGASKIFALS